MKISVSWATYGLLAFALMVAGCAEQSRQTSATVSQKGASSQTPTYMPHYQAPGGPGGVVISSARPALTVVPTPVPSTKVRVAILLPLSGKNAALGQAMLNAAQQAVFDSATDSYELQPHDTAAEGGAEQAARAALTEGAQAVIGPLFATDVPIVKAMTANAGVPLLPLSTDTSLAERGVYVMGLAPAAQVDRVVAYAVAHGARHFAALLPASPYGAVVGQAFRTAVMQQGATVVDVETMDGTEIPAKALGAKHMAIDALFLPESGAELKQAADQLTAFGFEGSKTYILGTGLWDGAAVGRQNALLIGAWYAAPDPATRHAFIASYIAAYGAEPPRLTTLAYDATALTAVLAKHGAHFDEASLTNPNGFAGLDGIFRLSATGEVERALAVHEVTADGVKLVDPAPASFVGRGR